MQQPDYGKIMRAVKPYPYVSFDIFDTLLKRAAASPEDIMALAVHEYGYLYGALPGGLSLQSLCKVRRAAQEKAQLISARDEVTFDEIYAALGQMHLLTQQDVKRLRELELRAELEACMPNAPMADVYNACLAQGKKTLIISDMYLSAATLEEMLHRCGIRGYTRLFVSSTSGRTKKSGGLFEEVLRALRLPAGDLIHIGDARRGDFLSPMRLGIRAVPIPRFVDNTRYVPAKIQEKDPLPMRAFSAFINHALPSCPDPDTKLGFETFGILLYAFVRWLDESLRAQGIEKVFFFARDGRIIKEAYDKIKPSYVHSSYLEVSRRSLSVPLLWLHPSPDEILHYIPFARSFTPRQFLQRAGLSPLCYEEKLALYRLTLDTPLPPHPFSCCSPFQGFYESIWPDIRSASQWEFLDAAQYLRQSGFGGRCAVVDIGWQGSMQRSLEELARLASIPHVTQGYYVGLRAHAKAFLGEGMSAHGFLFDPDGETDLEDCAISFLGLLETFFLAQEGSVKKYRSIDGRIEAERFDYEFEPDFPEQAQSVARMQQGALRFVEGITARPMLAHLPLTPQEAFRPMKALGVSPDAGDLKRLGGFPFFDGEHTRLAAPRRLSYYLFHPRSLAEDFSISPWKTAFLRRLLKLPLPYLELYQAAKRRRKHPPGR